MERVFCRHVGDRKLAVQGLGLGNSLAGWEIYILKVNKSELFQRGIVWQLTNSIFDPSRYA